MKRTIVSVAAVLLVLAGCTVEDGGSAKAKGSGGGAVASDTENDDVEDVADEPEEPDTYKPSKDDFKVLVKVTGKDCFGSAGCNVEYKVGLKWLGPMPAPRLDQSYDLYYRVNGLDDGGSTGTITVNPKLRYAPEENFGSTASSSDVLSATLLRLSRSNGF